MELTDFLLARLDEDEADARRQLAVTASTAADASRGAVAPGSPDRVLAVCAAQRHVVDAYLAVVEASAAAVAAGIPFVEADTLAASESSMASMQLVAASTYDRALRWYAVVYAGHPDYRDEWRP